jgi:hypothetical protein
MSLSMSTVNNLFRSRSQFLSRVSLFLQMEGAARGEHSSSRGSQVVEGGLQSELREHVQLHQQARVTRWRYRAQTIAVVFGVIQYALLLSCFFYVVNNPLAACGGGARH